VGNEEYNLVNLGKAGRSRWLGIRPTVRGTAMNPVDHPHASGGGRQGRGLRRAKSMWGKPTGKGQKTRTPKKYSNVFIVSRRKVERRERVNFTKTKVRARKCGFCLLILWFQDIFKIAYGDSEGLRIHPAIRCDGVWREEDYERSVV
jgi:hypothetical protein